MNIDLSIEMPIPFFPLSNFLPFPPFFTRSLSTWYQSKFLIPSQPTSEIPKPSTWNS